MSNKNLKDFDEKKLFVKLIDSNSVLAEVFPFFTSYKIFFDSQIKCYGFYYNGELVAVSAVIPEDADISEGFISVGCPIIYVFEVREDLRGKGLGRKCAELLINKVIEDDTIQLCCTPFVAPFWEKVGFELKFIDQSLYMHKMVLKKRKNASINSKKQIEKN